MLVNYFDDGKVNPQQAKDSKLIQSQLSFERDNIYIRYFFDEHLETAISDYLFVMRGRNYAN